MFSFPPETQAFLRRIGTHNEREWFAAHRAEYESAYVEPAKAFVEAVAPRVVDLGPDLQAEPRVLGSIFRLNRDTRFSADKRPYKEHLDLWFWEGERRAAVSGLYLRVTPGHVSIGAGANRLSREALDRYRGAVCDPGSGEQLAEIATTLVHAGWDLGEPRRQRAPKGWTSDDPDAEHLLCHDGLFITRREPPELATDAEHLIPTCLETWSTLAPLHRWFVEHVQR
jgi:uncharacterized protein (TIGR02453 family)